ncbi:GTP-binding protein [Dendrobium catenatum]|uniref:GTP-binding protein n=1 Tax=Dendrobium catenatum TaxID=906689 RepID=A0A2I0WKM2_9ASPA|nr:GTP-binding protein [Dendrobium catenatum]
MLRIFSRLRPPICSLSRSLNLVPVFTRRGPIRTNSPSPFCAPFSSSRKRKGIDEERDVGKEKDDVVPGVFVFGNDPQSPPRLFVVQPRLRPDSILDLKLSEALNLTKSLEEPRGGFFREDLTPKQIPSHLVVQNPIARSSKSHAGLSLPAPVSELIFSPDVFRTVVDIGTDDLFAMIVSDTYFGPGTVENIKTHLKALESESELAALMYKRSRLVRVRGSHGRLTFGINGEAEVVSGRGRGSGGRGFISGAGETELQLQRRRIQERRNHLLVQIDEVRRTRALQRSARRRHGGSNGHGLATVAVVGYTNAGKSTLVSALSNSDLYRDDRLFATVDPRLRSVILPSGIKTLLSDTVGFISDLPVQLVEAFHATLEEVVEADLLLHVLDSSAPNVLEQRSSVLEVLQKIGVSEEKIQNMVEVWNKIDLLITRDEALVEGEEERITNRLEGLKEAKLKEEDGILSNFQESIRSKQMAVVDLTERDLSSDLLQNEGLDLDDNQRTHYSDVQRLAMFNAHCEQEVANRIETSAITGIGLKELLSLISEKLSAQTLVEKKSYEPFNRKWRPSHNLEFDRAAEQ